MSIKYKDMEFDSVKELVEYRLVQRRIHHNQPINLPTPSLLLRPYLRLTLPKPRREEEKIEVKKQKVEVEKPKQLDGIEADLVLAHSRAKRANRKNVKYGVISRLARRYGLAVATVRKYSSFINRFGSILAGERVSHGEEVGEEISKPNNNPRHFALEADLRKARKSKNSGNLLAGEAKRLSGIYGFSISTIYTYSFYVRRFGGIDVGIRSHKLGMKSPVKEQPVKESVVSRYELLADEFRKVRLTATGKLVRGEAKRIGRKLGLSKHTIIAYMCSWRKADNDLEVFKRSIGGRFMFRRHAKVPVGFDRSRVALADKTLEVHKRKLERNKNELGMSSKLRTASPAESSVELPEFPEIANLTNDSLKLLADMICNMAANHRRLCFFEVRNSLGFNNPDDDWDGNVWRDFCQEVLRKKVAVCSALMLNPDKLKIEMDGGFHYLKYD